MEDIGLVEELFVGGFGGLADAVELLGAGDFAEFGNFGALEVGIGNITAGSCDESIGEGFGDVVTGLAELQDLTTGGIAEREVVSEVICPHPLSLWEKGDRGIDE